jgi:hypothetical protein
MSEQKKYHAYYRNVMSSKNPLTHTPGGLSKKDILPIKTTQRKKDGSPVMRYVSKQKHDLGKQNNWARAVKQARKELGLKRFVPVNGNSDDDGKKLYDYAKHIYMDIMH